MFLLSTYTCIIGTHVSQTTGFDARRLCDTVTSQHALIVQRIEQFRPKEEILVQFRVRAQRSRKSVIPYGMTLFLEKLKYFSFVPLYQL